LDRGRAVAASLRTAALSTLVLSLLGPGAPISAEDWPRFRGPTGVGLTTETDLPVRWGGPERENVLWQSPLVGSGHASPIVWGDRLFVTTVRWPEGTADRKKAIPEHHILSYRAADGALLWDSRIDPGPWLRDDFRSGPGGGYAAPTPATDGKRVYCAFGSSVVAALDFDGKTVWRKEVIPHTFDVTLGTSPVLHGGRLILLCAMAKPEDSRAIAWNAESGEVAWETKLPGMAFGHSTPVIVETGGRSTMIVLASGMSQAPDALRGLDPSTGERLWSCAGAGDAASPAFGSGVIYFDSGRGGPGTAVALDGPKEPRKLWTVPQVPEGICSPVIAGDHVYRLHAPDVLKCWKLQTGEPAGVRRLEGITTTWASPVATPEGRIYFASAGKSFVVEAGPELKVLATNDLADPGHASPAVSGGRLFLVGEKIVHCIGRKPAAPAAGTDATRTPRRLEGAERIVALRGGGYFPVLVRLREGPLVAVLRGGAGHIGRGGRLDCIRSEDGGRTWSAPVVAIDSEWDDRNPALGQMPDGILFLAYGEARSYRPDGTFDLAAGPYRLHRVTSADGGKTWGPKAEIPEPFPNPSPFGRIIVLRDGTAFLSVYKMPSDALGILRSRDGGRTWGDFSKVPGHDETQLLEVPGGRLLAFTRIEEPGGHGLLLSESVDGGRTWPASRRLLRAKEWPFDATVLRSGTVLLSFGYRVGPFGAGLAWSDDAGATWDPAKRVLVGWDSASADTGYPSTVELPDGTIVTMYYAAGRAGDPAEQALVVRTTEEALRKAAVRR
jgi:outer membrane protein assembly factor BamB